MIRIVRDRLDETGKPIRPDAAWFALAATSKAQALQDGAGHQILASVYTADAVRQALEKLFHDKCAYCEGKSIGQADWDVEHFRPKGSVAERDDHPGYYWLAYEWENLYPSCKHCNQKRKDRPRWGGPFTLTDRGPFRPVLTDRAAPRFPWSDGLQRSRLHRSRPRRRHSTRSH